MKKLFLLLPALVLSLVLNAQTDFSTPYNCSADDGVISGDAPSNKVYLNETADSHQIEWSDVSQDYTAVISWTVSVTTPCYISVSLDLGTAVSSNKHIFEVKVLDAGSNELGAVEEGPAYTGDGFTEAEQVKALSGKILLPAAGNYTIELRNNRNFCKGSIKNIILSYAGAAPVTDFSTPYNCSADDGVISGDAPSNKVYLNETADPHQIEWSDVSQEYTSVISWSVSVSTPCYISVSLDLGTAVSSNKHIFQVKVLDAGSNELGVVEEGPAYTGDGFTEAEQVKALSGKILLPVAGNYTIELRNNRNFCKGSIKNIILSYAGAAPVTDFESPYSCAADDAVLSGTISSKFGLNTEAEPHYIFWSDRALENPAAASWNIIATRACYISASLDLGPIIGSNKHIFEVYLKDADGNEIGMLTEGSESTESEQVKVLGGTLAIPAAGNYTIELKNNRDYGKGAIKNVILSYVGGEVQTMPGTTDIDDAWFIGGTRTASTKITFTSGHVDEGWAKWNVSFASAANYNVKLNIISRNGKKFTVALQDENGDDVVTPLYLSRSEEASETPIAVTLEMGSMEVPAGNYILKVSNAEKYSDAELVSVQFVRAGGGLVDIPGDIDFDEVILSSRAFIDGDGLHFTDDDHLGHISDEYAKWNIHVAADGIYKFTANCNTYETSWSNLTIQILQGGEEKYTYTPEYTYSGEKEIKSPEWFLEAGNYELKLSNPENYSNGYLVSLSAAAVEGILIVDEQATDMTYINEKNGQSMKPLLKRSFKGGMYNTIVFPFNKVTDEELTTIFGAGYELLEMASATLEDNTLNLNFAEVNLSADTYGRPYLIKPTQDVVNPLFNSHTIYKSTSHLTAEGTAADFIGSFIKGEVPAGEDNLFLGPDNLLYFSQTATPIKGTRAYFRVKGIANPAQAIKRARIVTGGQVATEINLVNESAKIGKSAKIIENGQLVIIRDGIRYNVMGAMIK